MRHRLVALAGAVLCVCAGYSSPVRFHPARLVESPFDDTETSTNVVFDTGSSNVREFRLLVELNADISNTVQIAFGVDADENGVLEWEETDFLLGWRCGGWSYRDKLSDNAEYVAVDGGMRTLDWKLTLDSNRRAKRLIASGDRQSLDFVVTSGMFNPEWNLARITTRGGETVETIAGELLRPGLTVKVR